MKTLSIISLLLLLTNCSSGSIAKIGKRCTVADVNRLQESSYIWIVSKEAQTDFNKRINKSNCLDS